MNLRISKKALSVLLAATLILSAFPLFVFAGSSKNEEPVIFIAGFASTPTVDADSREQVFPPSLDDFKPILEEYAWTILRAVLREQYGLLEEPMVAALYQAFDPILCDENGDPILPSASAYVPPTGEELRAKRDLVKGYTAENNIYYSFDWRLDLKTLAENLHDFIEYVLRETGAEKVRIIGSSMGGCLLATYMDLYNYEYISGAVFLSAAFRGTSVSGQPMTGRLQFEGDNLTAFLSAVLGWDVKGELLNAVVDALYQLGVTDNLALQANLIRDIVLNPVTDRALRYIFGRVPGFWSLVPAEYYDEAKEALTTGIVSDVFYEKIDFYHEIQSRVPAIIQTGMDKGIPVSIVSKYGLPSIPAIPDQRNMSDMIVDTHYSSLGATCATVDAPFEEREGEYVSADGYIAASTCEFPETTWFLKNVLHTAHPVCELAFLDRLLAAGAQPTVDTFPEYPRFLIQTSDGKIVPLTTETDESLFVFPSRVTGFAALLKRLFEDFRKVLSALFRMAAAPVTSIRLPAVRES